MINNKLISFSAVQIYILYIHVHLQELIDLRTFISSIFLCLSFTSLFAFLFRIASLKGEERCNIVMRSDVVSNQIRLCVFEIKVQF